MEVEIPKHFFAANKPPDVNDDTLAFWERWIYFEFPKKYDPEAKCPRIVEFFRQIFETGDKEEGNWK